jgi:thymidylate synthase (FAD)
MNEKFEQIFRPQVETLDRILGQPFPVLNDGFIRVIDYMGNDESIVQAARVSYGRGTKKRYQDRGLIRYLLRHNHTTPFEMCEIKLHVRVPMDTWRQWIRHRTANVNEYSTRYSVAIDAAQTTEAEKWRTQAQLNKQGSAGFLDKEVGAKFTASETKLQQTARDIYNARIEAGIAREQARKDLPLCTYTEAYWKIDLHNLLHFLQLRIDSHAQYEIRTYAQTIADEVVKRWTPVAWEAFEDYNLERQYLSNAEKQLLKQIIAGNREQALKTAEKFGLVNQKDGKAQPTLEGKEFEKKCDELGLSIPWSQ